ncbi:hypothetical protein SADUNF_Sadunf11G0070000 [Salix dunnii]|uniref:DNA-directed RNA polymerase n=1 Tax=Salix dunnii TaxID=1413687 RepID=A0A835JQC2_9ROSI|nr:hypothetical protein SADUNF_Sadunf11G0070000 [Salix dunnii]
MEKLGDDTCTKLDGKHKVFLNEAYDAGDNYPIRWKSKGMNNREKCTYFLMLEGSYALLWLLRTWMKLEHLRGRNYIFASLLDKGIIEFIGTEEEKDCCTAWGIRFLLEDIAGKQSMKYTHCELDIVDTLSHQLHYPQRPLFRTMISDCFGKPGYLFGHNAVLPKLGLFNGQNAIVAVNVHLSYN